MKNAGNVETIVVACHLELNLPLHSLFVVCQLAAANVLVHL
jgi:hypothetical protein